MRIAIDQNRCNLCGLCIPVCVPGILDEGAKGIEVSDPELCIACGHCKAVCPVDAPQMAANNEDFDLVPGKEEFPEPAAFLRFLRARRSLRVYQNRPVEKEKLQMIIEAGRCAPTGGNRQASEYIVVTGRKTLDRVCTLAIPFLREQGRQIQEILDRYERQQMPLPEEYDYKKSFPHVLSRMAEKWAQGVDRLLFHAPALILIHTRKNNATNPAWDGGIASAQMILMAEALELGTCFIGFLVWAIENSIPLQELLKVPVGNNVHVAFTVGYPGVQFLKLAGRNPAQVQWLGEKDFV